MQNLIPGGGSRTILLSKRANIFYLEKVRVYVRNERVIYQIATDKELLDYNLPDCNTALLLLGKGSSITDAAARALAKSGVVIGFAGSGGTPAHCLGDSMFMFPADEYRPTDRCQKWVKRWYDQNWKMAAAKMFQIKRLEHTLKRYVKSDAIHSAGVVLDRAKVREYRKKILYAENETELLLVEAQWTKFLYKNLAAGFCANGFKRTPGAQADVVNEMLDHGNYLIYGLATVALHALGIPPAFPLLHGKTRRGALVFDLADIYKDAIVMPTAFEIGEKKSAGANNEFRQSLIYQSQKEEILDGMIGYMEEAISLDVDEFYESLKDLVDRQ